MSTFATTSVDYPPKLQQRRMLLFLLAAIILILDQTSKFIVCRIILPGGSFPVIKNIFHLTHVQNQGAAFGLFPNQTLFFIGITLFTILLILFFHQRISKEGSSPSWALGLILGGAIGNLIDRIRLKAVIDFLDFSLKDHHWPSFNIADSAITIGAIILFVSLFRKK